MIRKASKFIEKFRMSCLIKATRKDSYAEDLDFLMDFYKDDFRSDILKAQLESLAALAHEKERFAR